LVKAVKSVSLSEYIGVAAMLSLEEEVILTPKPGLVDQRDSGSHSDLTLNIMLDSARVLTPTFKKIAKISYGKTPTQDIREEIAQIGRHGEKKMFETTNNINTHKGAIWALGLIASAYSIERTEATSIEVLETAGKIARYEDKYYVRKEPTNGSKVVSKYNVPGARGEAALGFPTIRDYGLPAYDYYNSLGYEKETIQLMTLMTLIANLSDTCILHRAGKEGLKMAQEKAREVIQTGDLTKLEHMNKFFIKLNISPGGSADLLATIIFLKKLSNIKRKDVKHGNIKI